MAVKLEKDLTRESSIEVDDRTIMVTLTKDQEITFKLKGMKSGAVSINIGELYNQLTDGKKPSKGPKKSKEQLDDSVPIINLHDFRSQYLISPDFPLNIKVRLESITVNLIKSLKK